MASNLAFNIFARDVDASRTFDKVGDSAERLSRRLDGIGRGASAVGGHLAGLGSSLASTGTRMVGSAAQLSVLAGAAAAAASSISGLVVALAPAAGAVAALPGAALLGAGALATLRVATSGVSDAFAAAMDGDPKKFAEALEKLSPAARAVAEEFQALKPALDGIKTSVQDALFAPLQGELTRLVETLGGPLRSGMTGVADGFAGAALRVGEFARSAETVRAVEQVFADLRRVVGDLTPALQPVLAGFRDIGVVGSGFLSGLAPSIGAAVARFGEFLSRAAESGQALTWMENALLVFKALGSIAKDVGGILKGIFGAAKDAGTGFLGIIGQMLEKVNAFVNSARGQEILVTIFEAMHRVGEALGPVIVSVAEAMATLAPAIADVAVAFAPVISAIIDALAPALAALAPGLVAVGNALARAFANPAVQEALLALGQAVSGVMTAVAPLIPLVAELAAQVITKLAPHIPPLAGAFVKVVEALLLLVPPLTDVAVIIAEQLARAIEEIAPYLPDLVKSFGDLLVSLTPLIPELVTLALTFAPLIPVVADILKLFAQLVNEAMPLLVGGVQLLTRAIADQVTKFTDSWDEAYQAVSDALSWAGDRIEEFVAWIKGFPGWVMSAVSGIRQLPARFRDWFQGAKDAAIGKANELIGWVRGIPGAILNALGNLGGLLYNAGRSIIQGLIDGLYSMLQHAYNAAADILNRIRSLFPFSPAKEGPFSGKGWVLYSGMSIAEGLAEGMARGGGMVKTAATRMAELASAGAQASVTLSAASTGTPALAAGAVTQLHLHFSGQPLIGREEISRTVIEALNEAKRRGFGLGALGATS